MDVLERLSVADIGERSLIASEHIHRYELAARLVGGRRVADLCCGVGYGTEILARTAAAVVGVDVDEQAIEAARSTFGSAGEPRFVAADAVAWLRSPEAAEVESIVCFEGLEHLPELDSALDALETLAAGGTQVVLSVPNSTTFEERNEFHVTEFGPESVAALARRFDDVVVVHQFHAEGSVVVRGDEQGEEDGRIVLPERADADYANHFVLLVNLSASAGDVMPSGRVQIAAAPQFNRWMLHLDQANRELWTTNARLARGQIGRFDAAAAALLSKAERAEREIAEAERRYWAMHLEARQQRELAELRERERDEARARFETLRRRKVVRLGLGLARLNPRNRRGR